MTSGATSTGYGLVSASCTVLLWPGELDDDLEAAQTGKARMASRPVPGPTA